MYLFDLGILYNPLRRRNNYQTKLHSFLHLFFVSHSSPQRYIAIETPWEICCNAVTRISDKKSFIRFKEVIFIAGESLFYTLDESRSHSGVS